MMNLFVAIVEITFEGTMTYNEIEYDVAVTSKEAREKIYNRLKQEYNNRHTFRIDQLVCVSSDRIKDAYTKVAR